VTAAALDVSTRQSCLATFSPPLDEVGNSVRGQPAARFLSHQLGLDLFASSAASSARGQMATAAHELGGDTLSVRLERGVSDPLCRHD